MALPELNPRAFDTLRTTAAARISRAVAQKIPSSSVRKIKQLLQLKDFANGIFGQAADVEQPLLGGMTLGQARETYAQLASAQLARKNLFFIQIVDYNPPPVEYAPGSYFTSLFNLFALDVSYSASSLVGEKIPLGSAMLDRLSGKEAIELNITTMDDSRGSLKRWFAAKAGQAAHLDGTFGLPSEYWIDVEIYHATPTAREDAYKQHVRMRPQSIQHEGSRRDQGIGELAMTFTEVDTFIKP